MEMAKENHRNGGTKKGKKENTDTRCNRREGGMRTHKEVSKQTLFVRMLGPQLPSEVVGVEGKVAGRVSGVKQGRIGMGRKHPGGMKREDSTGDL